MIRRFFAGFILFTMVLHFGYRFGLVDHLYKKRHEIAYAIGLIAEVPIALCGSQYDFGSMLKIENQDESQGIPYTLTESREINLFFISPVDFVNDRKIISPSVFNMLPFNLYRSLPGIDIFHPPLA